MERVLKAKAIYEEEGIQLYCGDTFRLLKKIEDKTFDMIFSDPPYFLSNNGISCQGGKMVSVNKGDWDRPLPFRDKHNFTKRWISQCYRILKDDGTLWISGTFHNIYMIGYVLEECGFKIINNITWRKTNPPPNISCKCFTHSTETVLWCKKDLKKTKYTFNYSMMKELNGGKQMKDVWDSSLVPRSEKREGRHPTQKPLFLLDRIILASTNENDLVLDPFSGSSTTLVSCKRLGRRCVGIENNKEYIDLSVRRLQNNI